MRDRARRRRQGMPRPSARDALPRVRAAATKEPIEFAAKPTRKTVKASPLKVAKDAV
jgi:hypothetical protein